MSTNKYEKMFKNVFLFLPGEQKKTRARLMSIVSKSIQSQISLSLITFKKCGKVIK